jgi:hypothetical protein
MIDAKQAVQRAKQSALEMLGSPTNLEEIERDDYKSRDTWIITLSLPQYAKPEASALGLSYWNPLQYKRFLIDAETGELIAIKLRELATQ